MSPWDETSDESLAITRSSNLPSTQGRKERFYILNPLPVLIVINRVTTETTVQQLS